MGFTILGRASLAYLGLRVGDPGFRLEGLSPS